MKSIKIVVLTFSILIFSCQKETKNIESETKSESPKTPKNIIFMIGDGMGMSQVSSAIYYKGSKSNFERFPIVGLSKTSSSSHKITDSGAGATAFSIGEKSFNGSIGVAADSSSKELITEYAAKEKKMKIGIIATSSITHATPASFFAHVDDRDKEEEIAAQMLTADVDYFAGGGTDFFFRRSDGRNIAEELEEKGYSIDTNKLSTDLEKSKKYGFILAQDGMPRMLDGRGDFLEKSTISCANLLDNENGFYIMVEGSQIDWGGHDNDGEYLISELIDFDETIGKVLDWAEKDGETLVVVTADHETGGFTLAGTPEADDKYNEMQTTFSSPGHSGTMVGVFAFGPGAEKFSGVYENYEIYHKMMDLLKK